MKKIAMVSILLLAAPVFAREMPMAFQSVFPEGTKQVKGFAQVSVGYGSSTIRPVGANGFESRFTGGISFAKYMEITAFYSNSFSDNWHKNSFSAGAEITATVLRPHGAAPGLAFGLMGFRDRQKDGALTGRATVFWDSRNLYGMFTTYFEKAFGKGRDPIDIVITAALGDHITRTLRLSLEYAAQDIEDAWEADEAEGGMRQFLGLDLGWLAVRNLEVVTGLGTDMSLKTPAPMARLLFRYSF